MMAISAHGAHFLARQLRIVVGVQAREPCIASSIEFLTRQHAIVVGISLEYAALAGCVVLRQGQAAGACERYEAHGGEQCLTHELSPSDRPCSGHARASKGGLFP